MMDRRNFIKAVVGGAVGSLSAAPVPHIDATAIQSYLTALSLFGRPAGGTFQSGVSRVGYSDADIAGRKFVTDLMDKATREFAAKPTTRTWNSTSSKAELWRGMESRWESSTESFQSIDTT